MHEGTVAYLTVRMIQASGLLWLPSHSGPARWALEFQCDIRCGTLRITPGHDMPCWLCKE